MGDLVRQYASQFTFIFCFQDKLSMNTDVGRWPGKGVYGRCFDDEKMKLVAGCVRVRCQTLAEAGQIIIDRQVIDKVRLARNER